MFRADGCGRPGMSNSTCPSLILLDMVMPGIGNPVLRRQGLDLRRRVRELGVRTPVLMMSGNYESRKEADALMEGAFGYVHKPFDVRELDRLVAKDIATPG